VVKDSGHMYSTGYYSLMKFSVLPGTYCNN